MVLKDYYHQKEELDITVWQTMGNNMDNIFPNFCICLIGSGAVSYIMAFCQLTMVDNSDGWTQDTIDTGNIKENYEKKHNMSLVSPGALAHSVYCRTTC